MRAMRGKWLGHPGPSTSDYPGATFVPSFSAIGSTVFSAYRVILAVMKDVEQPVPVRVRLEDFEWLSRSPERRASLAQCGGQQRKELDCYVRHFYSRN